MMYEIPTATVLRVKAARGGPWRLVEIRCPYCHLKHTHGWSVPGVPEPIGFRTQHCDDLALKKAGVNRNELHGYEIETPEWALRGWKTEGEVIVTKFVDGTEVPGITREELLAQLAAPDPRWAEIRRIHTKFAKKYGGEIPWQNGKPDPIPANFEGFHVRHA